jgi:adenine deaminase
MRLKKKDRTRLVDAAMGRIPLDLLIKNTKMVNVFTGEIYNANICILDGFVVHVQADPDGLGREEIPLETSEVFDAKGLFAIPGLIDAHVHIESTMMTPRNFAKSIIVHGSTTVVTDPHEIANVFGMKGVEYMIESSSGLPMRQLITVPSCVPAVPGMENAGAEFNGEEIIELLGKERVIGLAEVMDFPGVITNSPRMVEIVEAAYEREMFLQGHIIGMSPNMLSAYRNAGPMSDHETRDPQEARDKLRSGMRVDARHSSLSQNVADIVKNTRDFSCLGNLTLCTDDREPKDLLSLGHMNDVVRHAIAAGMTPVEAVRSATLNTAAEISAEDIGAIAPGYIADIVLLPSLEEMKPQTVFYEGELVVEEGRLKAEISSAAFPIETINSVKLDAVSEEDFRLKAPVKEGTVTVNVISYFSYMSPGTTLSREELPVKDGCIDISADEELKFACVMHRHGKNSSKSYAVVRGFGSKRGAVCSTVSHDSHNLTVVYDTPENAAAAANEIISIGGGIACADEGKLFGRLPLPLAGLMSLKSCEELAEESEEMKGRLRKLGLSQENPLLRIATLALPVIPELRMSDLGIVDVMKQEFIPLFPDF